MYRVPSSSIEWWDLLDEGWESTYFILNRFLDLKEKQDIQGQPLPTTLGTKILQLRGDRNREIVVYLEESCYTCKKLNIYTRYIAGYQRLEVLVQSSDVLWEGIDGEDKAKIK